MRSDILKLLLQAHAEGIDRGFRKAVMQLADAEGRAGPVRGSLPEPYLVIKQGGCIVYRTERAARSALLFVGDKEKIEIHLWDNDISADDHVVGFAATGADVFFGRVRFSDATGIAVTVEVEPRPVGP